MHRFSLLLSLLLSLAAFALIVDLLRQATDSQDAQTRIVRVEVAVREMQSIASRVAVGHSTPAAAHRNLETQLLALDHGLRAAESLGDDGRHLATARRAVREMAVPLRRIVTLSAARPRPIREIFAEGQRVIGAGLVATGSLQDAAAVHDRASKRSLERARVGTGVVIAALFAAFAWFFRRARRTGAAADRLAAEREILLAQSRQEALTDALTGLRNRRALLADVAGALASASPAGPHALVLFDLDGFKQYNDTFGHPAGDRLLVRLGARLAETVAGIGVAYRLGGDEFCVVASTQDGGVRGLAALAASALTEEGGGFSVGCSYGAVLLPADAATPDEALLLADQRMYEHKESRRPSPERQSADVLLHVLAERDARLRDHTRGVADLALRTARRLGLDESEAQRVRLGAELHDIGKAAVPDAILAKPAPLDPEEQEFMRRHTLIGERIALAAPSLAPAAALIRSSHERLDGGGYPDGLAGAAIPLGARIIAVCDAYDAMRCLRPYRPARSPAEALAELRRCAGTQFDPLVVQAFAAVQRETLAAA